MFDVRNRLRSAYTNGARTLQTCSHRGGDVGFGSRLVDAEIGGHARAVLEF